MVPTTPSPPSRAIGSPVAACIVRCRRDLASVVCHLRQRKILRNGRNVTSFNVRHYNAVSEEQDCGTQAAHDHMDGSLGFLKRWTLRRCEGDSGSADGDGVGGGEVTDDVATMWTIEVSETSVWRALEDQQQCYAVHFTGELSCGLIEELLSVTSDSNNRSDCHRAVVCVVSPLRVYSEACCKPEDLPAPLYELRLAALRSQDCHSCGGCNTTMFSPLNLEWETKKDPYRFTFSEVFAGIGMFRVGLERIGGKCVFAVECSPNARSVYHANHHCSNRRSCEDLTSSRVSSHTPLVGDITTIPSEYFPHHDVLTAGFPCQSFAKAGPATGLVDTKGKLFYEVVRVIRSAKPKAFLLENVENVLYVGSGCGKCTGGAMEEEEHQLMSILKALRSPSVNDSDMPSYTVTYRVIDGALVTPQRRRRVYFIGIRADLPRAGTEAMNDFLDDAVRELQNYRATHPEAPHCVRDILDDTLVTADVGAFKQSVASLRLTESQWAAVQRSQSFRRCSAWRVARLDGLARTLMGSYRISYQLYSEFVPMADGVPPLRFYSIDECARLQGIPSWFSFNVAVRPPSSRGCGGDNFFYRESDGAAERPLPVGAVYKLIGNAVNPIIVEYLGRVILRCLGER